ncbi:DUF6325 family protein [Streptomyces sp. NPDC059009]|uniref:DUF6325 family protein n=1 Tax=Streptomyces sp. NPDC059009 TaxID=3346694 RepID=UPI0036BD0DEF
MDGAGDVRESGGVGEADGTGPVEFLVLAFPGERPGRGAVAALAELRRSGEVRVMDSLVVAKAATGDTSRAELDEFEEFADVLAGREEEPNLIGPEDAEEAAAVLEPGGCALLVLVEHLWAGRAARAVRGAGGHIAASVRIPPDRVEQARAAYRTAAGADAPAAAMEGS